MPRISLGLTPAYLPPARSTVERVRELLHQLDHGPDRAATTRELEAMFALGEATVRPAWLPARPVLSPGPRTLTLTRIPILVIRLSTAPFNSFCQEELLSDQDTQPSPVTPGPPPTSLPPWPAPCPLPQSTFGYLQVVNPEVYAQLMDTKLDPDSPGGREYAQGRGVRGQPWGRSCNEGRH